MRTITFSIFFQLLLQITLLNAQAPALQWQKSLGGSENDFAFSAQQTKDGGYIIAGETASFDGNVTGNHGDEDFWVTKLDGKGNLTWQKALGGFGDEAAFAVEQTTDDGYILAGQASLSSGNVTGNHGNLDFWVVKLDKNGNLLWQKSLGGSNSDHATSIQETTDGGYIVAGSSASNNGNVSGHNGTTFFSDYWVAKLDAGGNIMWQDSYGGSVDDFAFSVRQTKDGGYIVAGNSESDDGDVTGVHDIVYGDMWVIKLDPNGVLQWERVYGGNDYDLANSIRQTTDGGYIIGGFSRSHDGDITNNHGNYDMWVVKTNDKGDITWQKSLGGSNGDFGYGVEQTPDGGYIVSGGTSSTNGDVTGNHGNEDFWVIKLDANGNLKWQSALGGSGFDEAKTVDQASDGGYIVAGYSGSNNGNVSGNHGQNDFWVTKLFSCNCIPPIAGLNTLNVTASAAKIVWDTVGCVLAYKIQYRISGSNNWTTKKVFGNHGVKKLSGLAPATTYEWKVASQCSAGSFSGFSAVQTFTTDPLREEAGGVVIFAPVIQLSLSPNPATDFLNLQIISEGEDMVMEMYDASGRMVLQKNLTVQGIFDEQISVSQLPAGVYLISLKSANAFTTARWIKE